ncbi:MAG: deoxyribose-phosphate aldolase [Ignavibacteria bacterium]|nr:deoxyribose-phosphate aldolase [Ignavibacteria bacterium]
MIHNYNTFKRLNEAKNNFNHLIDYTYLKKNATVDDIKKICEEAIENHFYSVCIYPEMVGTAKAFLENEDPIVCTVISFPNGDDSTNYKVKETLKAISNGADEIDMVFNYKKLRKLAILEGEDYESVYNELVTDVRQVAHSCHKNGVILKVIIEVEEINYNEIKLACEICVEAGADYIQTSTGFSKINKFFSEKVEQLKYMRKILPEYIKIKVSGGVRNKEQVDMVLPYVDRIGTSVIINDIKN